MDEHTTVSPYNYYFTRTFYRAALSTKTLSLVMAALLLIFRPQLVANLTNNPWGRCFLSLAKVISVLVLAFGSVAAVWPPALSIGNHQVVDPSRFIVAFTVAVLSFGSLQTPVAAKNQFVGRWIDVILHIQFLWYLVVTIPVFASQVLSEDPRLFTFPTASITSVALVAVLAGITSVLLVAVLLIENLQIPAAAAEVLLSSWRLHSLHFANHHPLQNGNGSVSQNLVPAIKAFYVLALCQGSLYITASILGLFSFFPRRLLVFQSRFSDQQQGAKAIDLYTMSMPTRHAWKPACLLRGKKWA
ncbi:hypothetical protein BS78_07G191900 [Paspalum vaginatum]|nr:hypothetical protein BS78_07G191900 [Paspalum vaginatum]